MSEMAYEKRSLYGFKETVSAVLESARNAGWIVLATHDMKHRFENKGIEWHRELTIVEICKASYANPADDSIESPNHPAVAHNAAVIVTQANQAVRDAGLDAAPMDMNLALLEALENPKVWRRWRDGKNPFTGPR